MKCLLFTQCGRGGFSANSTQDCMSSLLFVCTATGNALANVTSLRGTGEPKTGREEGTSRRVAH